MLAEDILSQQNSVRNGNFAAAVHITLENVGILHKGKAVHGDYLTGRRVVGEFDSDTVAGFIVGQIAAVVAGEVVRAGEREPVSALEGDTSAAVVKINAGNSVGVPRSSASFLAE